MRFSGSTRIDGGLNSNETIVIDGSTTIRGSIKANNVIIGRETYLGGRKTSKHPYKVFGKIFATNDVESFKSYSYSHERKRELVHKSYAFLPSNWFV